MEMASRSSRDFPVAEDDEFGRRCASYQKVDLSVKVDRKNGGDQEQPSTPRSKHSATEQRRRSKINDRFQILRDLIPHSDQKRDKASFLLEVIEYIRFLHEKVQKYESCHEMPWPNLYASVGRGTGFTHPQKRLISDSNNMASQSQEQWHRPQCPLDCIVNSDMLDEQDELIVDEGTISVSNTYSQGLLAVLTQSLESSGLDLSQASVSVQISLGKRAKRPTLTGSSAKDRDDPSSNRAVAHSMVGSSGEESEQASKRHRSDVS